MPKYRAPESDLQRLAFMHTALQTASHDRQHGREYLSQACIAELAVQLARFAAAYEACGSSLGARKTAVDHSEVAYAALKAVLRALWGHVRVRARLEGQPVSVLHYYQLVDAGRNPNPGCMAAWLALGQAVLAGHGEAVAQGFEAEVYPGIERVAQAVAAFAAARAAVALAERAYQQAQQALAGLRRPADLLIRRVLLELRASLYAEDEPGFRRVARSYGAVYRGAEALLAAQGRTQARGAGRRPVGLGEHAGSGARVAPVWESDRLSPGVLGEPEALMPQPCIPCFQVKPEFASPDPQRLGLLFKRQDLSPDPLVTGAIFAVDIPPPRG